MKLKTTLTNLNYVNGADELLYDVAQNVLDEFKGHVYGCEMGIAYGGGVEGIGSLWGKRGDVWGFDTFEDMHPKHLAVGLESNEAKCMDAWYGNVDDERYNNDHLALAYQQQTLHDLGLSNVHLVKGEVNKDSCKDIPKLHYAMMDMDMIFSMKQGWEAIKDKVVKGGYVCLHDVVPQGHLEGKIYPWWHEEIMPKFGYEMIYEEESAHLGVYKKK